MTRKASVVCMKINCFIFIVLIGLTMPVFMAASSERAQATKAKVVGKNFDKVRMQYTYDSLGEIVTERSYEHETGNSTDAEALKSAIGSSKPTGYRPIKKVK